MITGKHKTSGTSPGTMTNITPNLNHNLTCIDSFQPALMPPNGNIRTICHSCQYATHWVEIDFLQK